MFQRFHVAGDAVNVCRCHMIKMTGQRKEGAEMNGILFIPENRRYAVEPTKLKIFKDLGARWREFAMPGTVQPLPSRLNKEKVRLEVDNLRSASVWRDMHGFGRGRGVASTAEGIGNKEDFKVH